MKNTVYECCVYGKDVQKTLKVVHCAETQAKAIEWLEAHGGGVYRNILHNFSMYVPAK